MIVDAQIHASASDMMRKMPKILRIYAWNYANEGSMYTADIYEPRSDRSDHISSSNSHNIESTKTMSWDNWEKRFYFEDHG